MSLETLTAFENIYVMMQEQRALIDLFTKTFATNIDEQSLVRDITALKDTFLNSASLIDYLAATMCENMDAAIDAAWEAIQQHKKEVRMN